MYSRPLRLVRTPGKKMDSLAIRMALRNLPIEIQHKIVQIAREPPPAPKKTLSVRLQRMMERWSDPSRPKIQPRVLFT